MGLSCRGFIGLSLISPRDTSEVQVGPIPCQDIHVRRATVYSDTTRQFLVASSRGNSYILVAIDLDSNYIFAEPMSSRSKVQIFRAYSTIHATFQARGLAPQLSVMDNEASQILKDYITSQGTRYATNWYHRTYTEANRAERAIRTFKNHFISGLSDLTVLS